MHADFETFLRCSACSLIAPAVSRCKATSLCLVTLSRSECCRVTDADQRLQRAKRFETKMKPATSVENDLQRLHQRLAEQTIGGISRQQIEDLLSAFPERKKLPDRKKLSKFERARFPWLQKKVSGRQTQSVGLAEEQFMSAVGRIVSTGKGRTEKELRQWYMKIDVNGDGSVDKEEFVNWLLMENMGFVQIDDQPVRRLLRLLCSLTVSSVVLWTNQVQFVRGTTSAK